MSNKVENPHTTKLASLWRRLTEPYAAIEERERRRQAHLLTSLILALILFTIALNLPYIFILSPEDFLSTPYTLFTYVFVLFLLIPYWLSRKGRYEIGALLIVVTISAGLFLVAPTGSIDDIFVLSMMFIPVLIANVFLPFRVTVAVACILLAGISAFAALTPEFALAILAGPLSTTAFGSGLIVLFAWHRNRLEADRQQRLEEQRQLLQTIFDHIPVVVALFDSDGKFEMVNRAYTQIMGWTLEDVKGRDILAEYYPDPEIRAQVRARMQAAQREWYDLKTKVRDGRVVDTAWTNVALPNGRRIGIGQDITQRKQAEEVLRQAHDALERLVAERTAALLEANASLQEQVAQREAAEKKLAEEHDLLKTLINLVPDYIYIKDTESRFVLANTGVARGLGAKSPEEMIGKTDFDFFPEETAERFYRTEQAVIRSGEPVFDLEELDVTSEGVQTWILSTKVPLRDSAGRITGLVGIGHNITERKMAERALEQRVAERTAELMEATKQLEQEVAERRQTEEALRQSEERYRIVSELISDYAYALRVEEDGTPVHEWITDSFARVTGYQWYEIDSQGRTALYHPDDAARVVADVERVLRGETNVGEYRIITRQGEMRWIQIYRRPVWDEAQQRVIRFYGVAQDITERKRAETILRESEEHMRSVIENMPVMMDAFDADGNIIVWNRECERVTGFSAEEIVGNPHALELLYPDAAYRERRRMGLIGQGLHYRDWEWQVACKDGSKKIISWFNISERFPIPGWADWSVGVDITERKQAEEALRESEGRYRIISELISDYAYSYRIEPGGGIFDEWTTDSFVRVTGYQPDEVSAKGTYALYHPDDTARAAADVAEVLKGKPVTGVYRIITKAGELRWLQIYRLPVWDDVQQRVIRFYGVAQDITERKQAEEALRESEARYRVISELISDYAYAFRVDPDGDWHYEWVTESFTRVTGYSWEEIREKDDSIYPPGDRERAYEDVRRVIRGELVDGEYRIITKWGELRWVRIYRRPDWDAEKQRVIRFYGVAQDITERKEAEAQRLRQVLERERLSLMSRFVLAVSHDFRTTLANIETSRYLIQRTLSKLEQEKVQAKLDTISECVIHLTEQLENFHTVSFLADPSTEKRNVNHIIESLLNEEAESARDKQITVTFAPDEDLSPVLAEEEELKRAVRHLLINALSYTPEGGRVNVRTYEDGGYVMIEVQDSGIGIAPEHLPHIFDFFYRVDPSRAVESGGVGLGLSIVKMVAEAHAGKVDVQSTAGKGSVFTFSIPAAEREGLTPAHQAEA